MTNVLITGASGQLGQCFRKLAVNYPDLDFTFATSEDLDISLFGLVGAYFRKNNFDYCINCAAYTKVEQAEKEQEMAYLINSEAVKELAMSCEENNCVLVHFSTDYVFDGKSHKEYSEEDETNPLNVYGASKLRGEEYMREHLEKYFIFRTSWLYSDIGHNFFNTIRRKVEAGEKLGITTTQTGTPTNACDLAGYVLQIISSGSKKYGTYHYSNLGEATWLSFAQEIIKNLNLEADLEEDNDFQTIATRPQYSVLSKNKILGTFKFPILSWKESLKQLF